MTTTTWNIANGLIYEVEDALQEAMVFVSGVDGRKQHMYSYMTIMDYLALDKAWEELKDKYPREHWFEMFKIWHARAYLSPMSELLPSYLENKLKDEE